MKHKLRSGLLATVSGLLLVSGPVGNTAVVAKTMPIGSSSMEPNFQKSDHITVDVQAFATSDPARWDVVTYVSPANGKFWTHRVIGLPGDTVDYSADKKLSINGIQVKLEPKKPAAATGSNSSVSLFLESLEGTPHLIQLTPNTPALLAPVPDFPHKELCSYQAASFSCKVPPGNYFVMGDNRDNSADSRYLGFVPAEKIGGRVIVPSPAR
jgi:signal peptidase I